MDKETYEKQKAFAGKKVPSMNRRCVGHDYQSRQIYMITMVTEGRRPLFGQVVGRSDAVAGEEAPHIVLSKLGEAVVECWMATHNLYPAVEVIALQMMPDHLHGILFVKERMEQHLGQVIKGFKTGCNKAYRRIILGQVEFVATRSQQTGQAEQTGQTGQTEQTKQIEQTKQKAPRPKDDRRHGLLFARGYNDRLLLREGQLDTWLHYLADNPRRLLMKREHPDLFRVRRGIVVNGQSFSAIGNLFLLQRPFRLQVQCSRRLTEAEIKKKVDECMNAAAQGAVLVSPSISRGEKAVMRAAFERGYPLIYLQENGFTDLAKPNGKRMDACARGQLLILAPWEHHNERTTISRNQCLSLNDMARSLCEPLDLPPYRCYDNAGEGR
ncbi:MAG: hypothetical protein J6Z10_03815 [Prevotella sp.]|nr:hypothetical protein [Prevotella sp.]